MLLRNDLGAIWFSALAFWELFRFLHTKRLVYRNVVTILKKTNLHVFKWIFKLCFKISCRLLGSSEPSTEIAKPISVKINSFAPITKAKQKVQREWKSIKKGKNIKWSPVTLSLLINKLQTYRYSWQKYCSTVNSRINSTRSWMYLFPRCEEMATDMQAL